MIGKLKVMLRRAAGLDLLIGARINLDDQNDNRRVVLEHETE